MNEKVADSTESLPSSSVMRRNLKGFATRFLLSTFLLRKLILKTSLVDLFRIYVSFFQCFTFVRADRNFLYFFLSKLKRSDVSLSGSEKGSSFQISLPRRYGKVRIHGFSQKRRGGSSFFLISGESHFVWIFILHGHG